MTLDVIRDLYAYNRWANHRVLDAVEPLSPAQLTRDLRSSFPSVLDTLVHLLFAEWMWLSRWEGRSPSGVPSEWDLRTLPALRGAWGVVETELAAFVATLDSDSLVQPLAYRTTKGASFRAPLWQLLVHLVNHQSYHRGQVATMLRQLGLRPPSTDLLAYHREGPSAAG